MAMPNHFVLVRHGESEGNFVHSSFKDGDATPLTDEYRNRPGHEWRLTGKGVEQAQAAGAWIADHIIAAYDLRAEDGEPGFGRYYHSPHRRTRETAGHLGLPGARWRLDRLLREREWGEIGGMLDSEHRAYNRDNYEWKQNDPLHWAPPGGESITQVAENRVREVLNSQHRAHDEKNVLSSLHVTHGEFIWAARLVLDYMTNDDYEQAERDQTQKINNCQVVHYTRINPQDPEEIAPYLRWRRSVWPWDNPDYEGEWQESGRKLLGNEELLRQVETIPRLY